MTHLKNAKGFTLIEVLIALFVSTLAIGGYIGANVAIQRHSEDLHERSVATQEAHRIIEQIRDEAQTDTFPDHVTDEFPDGSTIADVTALPDEQITITYADAAADPLDVTVTVTWTSHTGRDSTTSLRSYITQR